MPIATDRLPSRTTAATAALLMALFLANGPAQAAPAMAETAPSTGNVKRTALLSNPVGVPPRKPEKRAKKLTGKAALIALADKAARRYGVSRDLVHAVILTESAYNPKALSHKNAMGLMQLIPGTAKRYGVRNAWDPAQNIDGGVRYLRDLLRQFDDTVLAVAAYNAGENAVVRYGNQVPPFAETQGYVVKIQAYLARLQSGASVKSLIGKGVGGGGRGLSGWGLIFGFFHERGEAQAMVREQRAKLKGVVSKGWAAVVPRQLANGKRYGALLVGLGEADAGAACKHLRGLRVYCYAITPGELKDPRAIWGS